MLKKKISIIGYGYVGKAMTAFFRNKYPTVVYDPYIDYWDDTGNTSRYSVSKEKVNETDLAVVCVPTPMKEDGSCDTSIVEEVVSWIETPLILIKSTVPPGTTYRLEDKYNKTIVFSPEYCGEPDYNPGHNFQNTVANEPFYIFGGSPVATSQVTSIFARIAGPCKTYMQCTAGEAEIIKYMENSFLATKVVFTYEMEQICKVFNEGFHTVREGWLLDPRINRSHTMVFEDNISPFSGKCLPKDLNAIVKTCEIQGYSPNLIKEVLASNERLKDRK